MLSFHVIIYLPDIAGLPKYVLEDVAITLDIPNHNSLDLALEIYEKINKNIDVFDKVKEFIIPYIFAGRTSVSWYPIRIIDEKETILELITKKIRFNPLLEKNPVYAKIDDEENISVEPKIIGGIKLNEVGTSYLLRLIYRSESRRKLNGLHVSNESITSLVTVIINEEDRFLEIRGNDRVSKKIQQYFGKLLEGEVEPFERIDIIVPFGNSIESFADSLGGKLVETVSFTDTVFPDLTEEQAIAIGNILVAIDDYFLSGDLSKLEDVLRNSRQCFDKETEDYLSVPFTAIVLAGMNKLGMTANDELRDQPLYKAFQPYLQHQGGFLQFPFVENGVKNYYTLKVGLTTNTIYFVTPATEKSIEFVRKKILKLD
ncbi:MAG: hypothetical protein LOD89_05910 [Tissierellales bacterium]